VVCTSFSDNDDVLEIFLVITQRIQRCLDVKLINVLLLRMRLLNFFFLVVVTKLFERKIMLTAVADAAAAAQLRKRCKFLRVFILTTLLFETQSNY